MTSSYLIVGCPSPWGSYRSYRRRSRMPLLRLLLIQLDSMVSKLLQKIKITCFQWDDGIFMKLNMYLQLSIIYIESFYVAIWISNLFWYTGDWVYYTFLDLHTVYCKEFKVRYNLAYRRTANLLSGKTCISFTWSWRYCWTRLLELKCLHFYDIGNYFHSMN